MAWLTSMRPLPVEALSWPRTFSRMMRELPVLSLIWPWRFRPSMYELPVRRSIRPAGSAFSLPDLIIIIYLLENITMYTENFARSCERLLHTTQNI
jgi:hypothetical protein